MLLLAQKKNIGKRDNKMNDAFVFQVLDFIATNNMIEELEWVCNQDKTVQFYINCNDLFFWACADAVELTETNFQDLVQAVDDVHNTIDYSSFGSLLFCARQRKMRPQNAYYEYMDKKLWPLFDTCGPERDSQILNPKERLKTTWYNKLLGYIT
jgi:hypothetical protein